MKFHFLLFLLFGQCAFAQSLTTSEIHSHNDYKQIKPFWDAYKNNASSIEVDIVMLRDTLFVSHHKDEIINGRTIEKLYLEPMQEVFSVQSDSLRKLQLLIDVKSDAKPTLERLIEVLTNYEVLLHNDNLSFVISGHRPAVEEYGNYPDYILFDYQSLASIANTANWKKIALISLPFSRYSKWNGESKISQKELAAIKVIADKAHRYGKPFRFWGTPDTKLAWKTFAQIGIDYINTDQPAECALYFKK